MANFIPTPNMNLPNPVPGVDPGPDYSNNLQSCLNILDQHNHTTNSGVLIPSGGININADLPFNSNNATLLRSTRFVSQAAALNLATDINCLYVVNGNLYFNDGLSDSPIQVTAGGAVNATHSGITDGSGNSASFISAALVVQNSSTAPDNIQCASIILGNQGVTSSNYVTISPVGSLGSSYSLTLPILPVAPFFMTLDSSGNIGTASSIFPSQIAAASLTGSQIASGTITAANIATGTITRVQQSAVGQNVSNTCGNYSTSSTSFTLISNMSLPLTTSGKPVIIMIQPDGSTNAASIGTSNAAGLATIQITRNGTSIAQSFSGQGISGTPASFTFLDAPGAGTYTYDVNVKINNGSYTFAMGYCVLVVYEL